MKRALIVDTETTGLDPATSEIVEIGAVVYSIEHQSIVRCFSDIVHTDANPAEQINRIPAALLVEQPDQVSPTNAAWHESLDEADVIVAHNADFDRGFLASEGWLDGYQDIPWLCTKYDFAWPRAGREGEHLIQLAVAHGIGVGMAHRAITDCLLIAQLFDRMDDLPAMFAHAARPKGIFQAVLSYDDRQLAKDAGFRWDPEAKRWTRRMAVADAEALPFRVVPIAEVA